MTTLSAKIAGVIAAAAGAIGTFAQNPGANMLPLGLVVFGFYGAICSVPALLERRGTAG
jgi:hypothetical protein